MCEALFQAVQEPDYAWVLVDSTTVNAHKAAAGQKSAPTVEGLGRSPGGFSTKLHAVVDALGNGLLLGAHPGPPCRLHVVAGVSGQALGAVVADKAYDTNAVLAAITSRHAEPVIPPKSSRNEHRSYDQTLYADRNKAERFFGRLKEARGFATRYDKTAVSFLATAHLLASLDWLR